MFSLQFEVLYGKKAAALYTQAGDYQKTARFYYKKAEDTYYQVRIQRVFVFPFLCVYVFLFICYSSYFFQSNNWAAYDDWRRARDQWDYFYSRNR